MKVHGDFSRWSRYKRGDNFNGVLYQQGRVLSDADGTTQSRFINEWQHVAGSDIIGSRVAAIPTDEPHSFKIKSAKLVDVTQQKIQIEVEPPAEVLEDPEDKGRAWVEGMVVYLEGESPITRIATYLGPPFHDVPPLVSPGSRDAVILEVYQDTINAFQLPEQLLEPALGGLDTTEILHTSYTFRLLRLSQEDNCSDIPDKLKDNFSDRGRLTVSLQRPSGLIAGECPVDENYGYTGITHNLYRIEIANVNSGLPPKFKWSQFNGGLVGRGKYADTNSKSKIMITHNLPPIISSELKDMYLEIVTYDEEAGYWKVEYGTAATLNVENQLILSDDPIFGTDPPADTDGIFFRLWNGIRDISEFTSETTLIDGIRLKLDPPNPPSLNYQPQDYWMFEVRAGSIENDPILVDNSIPHGIHYRRVPLSIIEWKTDNTTLVKQDCRVPLHPLLEQKTEGGGCCTFQVKVGDSIQNAIDSIGDEGGEICLLAGEHKENVIVKNKSNIVIRGCGNRVKITQENDQNAILSIIDSSNILVQGIEFETHKTGAILLEESASDPGKLHDIEIENNIISSFKNAIEINGGFRLNIHNNNITMTDAGATGTGIYIKGRAILVEKNRISVENNTQPQDNKTPAGIQIGNGSEGVKILCNKIVGGCANGITLGEGEKAVIREVSIDSNDISEMGLSGIGMPRPISPQQPPKYLVDGLRVCRNHIAKCLQKPFDNSMSDEVKKPWGAFGGIVLIFCDEVYILENTIEQNGRRHNDPVCGIFIYNASSGVQIIQNRILDNGPLNQDSIANPLVVGNRGGVVLPFLLGKINTTPSEVPAFDRPASIHDNVISQPAGLALQIGTVGTVSIINNYFKSEIAYFSIEQPHFLIGCVFITNEGLNPGHDLMTGVIFNNNQTVLGPLNDSQICQYLKCEDADLTFGSNHSSCLSSAGHMNLKVNTTLVGKTLRVLNNRFEEFVGLSLECSFKLAIMTLYNQCDHGIIVHDTPVGAKPPLVRDNQEGLRS